MTHVPRRCRRRRGGRRRSPLLELPAAREVLAFGEEARLALAALLGDLRRDASRRARKSWRARKAPMAGYWRDVQRFATHACLALLRTVPRETRARLRGPQARALPEEHRAGAEVRNPLLALPAAQRLLALPAPVRSRLADTFHRLHLDAGRRADAAWRKRRTTAAVRWRASSVYAGHVRRILRRPVASAEQHHLFDDPVQAAAA